MDPKTQNTPPSNAAEALDVIERLGDEVRRLHMELEHSQRLAMLGTISGMIAHEFNNLLTPIMSYAQMALECPEDKELAAKAFNRAVESGGRAAQIAEAVLAFARPEGKRAAGWNVEQNAPTTAAVAMSLETALSCMARNLDRDGVSLVVSIKPEVVVAMRPVALSQVMLNLVMNARNAMVPEGGRMRVSAEVLEKRRDKPDGAVSASECSTWNTDSSLLGISRNRGNQKKNATLPVSDTDGPPSGGASEVSDQEWVRVVVEDSGRGMTAEQLGRIFLPFVTSGSATSGGDQGVTRGTGLGLTVTRRLVEEVGGEIWVESTVGKGSRFTIVLPRA